jgi:hypothetical protein
MRFGVAECENDFSTLEDKIQKDNLDRFYRHSTSLRYQPYSHIDILLVHDRVP